MRKLRVLTLIFQGEASYEFSLVMLKRPKNFQTRLQYCKFILYGHFGVHNQRFHPQQGHMGSFIATKPVLFNGKSTKLRFFMFKWENTCKILYFVLFILMKAMPRCTLTPITTNMYTFWSEKWRTSLTLTVFDNFSYFLIWHRLWRHSYMSYLRCWYLFGING